ncbi:trichohyalin-like, partial [Cyrtonyx montezumae]|uniref:trichohyalin-like n=1 Tax=Cyrtonyx montezumae TaxID=9017 RepID=UPI0032D9BA56
MSHFLDSVSTIITVFYQHAKEDGDQSKLNRRKMKEFIQKEFADAIANPHDPQTIDKILQFLEWDGDGEIDFNEFLLLVFRVAKACYWYLQKGQCLLQRTKLVTSSKTAQEPEIKNRGSCQQLQEEEPRTRERNRHPPCLPEPQRDTRVQDLETQEETGSHRQERNTKSRADARRRTRLRELIPQEYEERSQEPGDQSSSQRRQPPKLDRLGDLQDHKRSSWKAPQRDGRKNEEEPQPEQLADVRTCSQSCEPQPLPDRQSGRKPREAALPDYDQRKHRPQDQEAVAQGRSSRWPHEPEEAHRGRHNQPQKPELLEDERSHNHLRELEQKELERSSCQMCKPECPDLERLHQSHLQEPLVIDHREYNKRDLEEGYYAERKRDTERRPYKSERYERKQEDIVTEADVDIRRVTRRGERVEEARRPREPVRYERTREDIVAEAEADVEIRRVTRKGERVEEARRRQEPVRYERTREDIVAEAEADVDIRRVTRKGERVEEARRPRETVRYERTREDIVAEAEAEVDIR